MPITKERAQFIANLANDEWIDQAAKNLSDSEFDKLSEEWSRKTAEFLERVQSSEELHLFVDLWNWDGAIEEMYTVAEHPACERATALMLFWRAGADFYDGRNEEECEEYDLEGYEFVKRIQVSFLAGFYVSGELSYAPIQDGYIRAAEVVSVDKATWSIATQMIHGVGCPTKR